MNILFLHPNFPGQFRNISRAFGDNGYDTRFMCQTHYGRTLRNVQRITLKNSAGHDALEKLKLPIIQRSLKVGSQYRNGFKILNKEGWKPDLVISHSGFGCGLYVKELWPETRLISYLEWWFDPNSEFFSYDEENTNLGLNSKSAQKCWLRNQQVALELAVADEIVSPTMWQRNQLPLIFKKRCHIIFDGVNTNIFKASEEPRRANTITYGTRGMDPMRCFPQLIESMIEPLQQNRDLTLEIAGEDKVFYGKNIKESSWKDWAKKILSDNDINKQVQWKGRLGPGEYEKWLQTSSCHIYLSHPFVASWSLVEAFCCGTPLVVSDIEFCKEICTPDIAVTTADHRKKTAIQNAVQDTIGRAHNTCVEIMQARNPMRFGIRESLEAWGHVAGVVLTTMD